MLEERAVNDPDLEQAGGPAFAWPSALSARLVVSASDGVSSSRSMGAEQKGGSNTNKPISKPTVEEVARQERAFIERTLRGLRVSASDLEDATQEVLIGAHRNLASFDPAPYPRPHEAIRAWLFRICERVAAHVVRNIFKRSEVLLEEADPYIEDDGSESPHDAAEREETRRQLNTFFAQIQPERAAILFGYYLEEKSVKDLASLHGIPENTAWNRIRLGLRDIRAAHARTQAAELNRRPRHK